MLYREKLAGQVTSQINPGTAFSPSGGEQSASRTIVAPVSIYVFCNKNIKGTSDESGFFCSFGEVRARARHRSRHNVDANYTGNSILDALQVGERPKRAESFIYLFYFLGGKITSQLCVQAAG